MIAGQVTTGPAVQAIELAPGLRYYPGYLAHDAQEALLAEIRQVLVLAPLYRPTMPRSGAPLSVQMTNCGSLGWISDRDGYRYVSRHPVTQRPWPPLPARASTTWEELARYPRSPEACLVNYYADDARMGLHQDRDEESFAAPVVSLSLGDTCVFRFGGNERRGPTRSVKLESGDALVLGGSSRLAFHGVDRILGGSSTLLPEGGRFNLTLRRVTGELLDETV